MKNLRLSTGLLVFLAMSRTLSLLRAGRMNLEPRK
jgi:hypothetical protein